MVQHSVEKIPPKIDDNNFAIDGTTKSTQEQQEASTDAKKNLLTQQLPSRQGRKRERSLETSVDGDNGDKPNYKKKQRLSRSLSCFSISVQQPLHVLVSGEGLRYSSQKMKVIKLVKKASKKRNKAARRG